MLAAVMFAVGSGSASLKKEQADKGSTSITYYLVHPMHHIEATSKDVQCTAELDFAARVIKSVTVAVDVTTFDSGNSSRDSHAMEVIDALEYPESTFTSKQIDQRGDSLFVTGTLTFHGISRDETIAARPQWSNSQVVVNGTLDVLLSDFKIERPSLLMIPVKDDLKFTLTAMFKE
jgi:polyisoprenoid-binding protein YceI